MARPRGYDDDEVAQAFLDAFWLRGYAGTAVSDLRQATGLLPGSIYFAFGSKEQMFRVAVERYAAQLGRALASERQGLAALEHVFDTLVHLTATDPDRRGCLMLNAIAESHAFSDETRARLQAGLDWMRRYLRDRLLEAKGKGRPRADLDELAALLFGATVAIRVLGRAGHERRALQDIADGAMDAVRRALAPS